MTAPGRTVVQWTLRSVTDQDTSQLQSFGPPVSSPWPDEIHVLNNNPANGPLISLVTPRGRERWPTLWVVTEIFGQPAYECLCTELGLWSTGLRDAGGAAQLTGNYPALPPGTGEVDIVLPGFGSFRKVPVVAAPDSAASVLRAERCGDRDGGPTWSRIRPGAGRPPTGRPTYPIRLSWAEYRSAVERIGPLPTG